MNQREAFEKWWKNYTVNSWVTGYPDAKCCADDAWQAAQQAQWQPIETAPRDGQYVMLYYDELHRPSIGKWFAPNGFCEHWCIEGKMTPAIDPKYWMPLPPEPKQ